MYIPTPTQIAMCITIIVNICNAYKIVENCVNNNDIALTFDDGPHPNTNRILDILERTNSTATFFINGKNYWNNRKFEPVLLRMYNSGHTIGTHTYSHFGLSGLTTFKLRAEFYDNELIFRELFGVRPLFYRPPFFDYNDNVAQEIYDTFGYSIVLAPINTFDYMVSATESSVFEIIKNGTNGTGMITLQHDYSIASVDSLRRVIIYLKSIGKNIVNLKSCAGTASNYQTKTAV